MIGKRITVIGFGTCAGMLKQPRIKAINKDTVVLQFGEENYQQDNQNGIMSFSLKKGEEGHPITPMAGSIVGGYFIQKEDVKIIKQYWKDNNA